MQRVLVILLSLNCRIILLVLLWTLTPNLGFCDLNEWSLMGLPNESVCTLHILPDNPNIMIAGSNHIFMEPYTGGIFRSIDSGAIWDTVALRGMGVKKIIQSPLGSRTLYAAADLGLYRSYDDGVTWYFVTNYGVSGYDLLRSVAVDPLDTLHILIAVGGPAGGRLGASTDGGSSWHLALHGSFFGVTFHPFSPNYAYAWGPSGIWQSDDHGYNWELWYDAASCTEPSNSRTRIWVNRQGLQWTDDFGQSWSSYTPDSVSWVNSLVQEVLSDTGIAVSTDVGTYLFQDVLGEWESINQGAPSSTCTLINTSPNRSTLFGRFYRGLWSYTFDPNSLSSQVQLEQPSYHVYPNPVVDRLNLSLPKGDWNISLFNILGQKILIRNINTFQQSGFQPWQLRHLASGTYFLLIQSKPPNVQQRKWVSVIQKVK